MEISAGSPPPQGPEDLDDWPDDAPAWNNDDDDQKDHQLSF